MENSKMKMQDLRKLSTPELLLIYNTHAIKPTARFADRKSALRRVEALLAALNAGNKPQVDAPAPASLKMADFKAKPRVLVAPQSNPNDITEHRSLKAAFIAFKLPLGNHKKFRRKLKLSGEEIFNGFIFKATYHKPKKEQK